MKDSDQSKDKFIYREHPPTFPMGFRLGASDDVCIIDFIDIPASEVKKVSYSVALTKKQSQQLITMLNNFIEKE